MNSESEVWLEAADGRQIPIQANCALGRGTANSVVLSGAKVSRRHATIHVQDGGQFWLVDLGSSNGTYLNNRRVNQPVRLSNADSITIGDETFIFRLNDSGTGEAYQSLFAQPTVSDIRDTACWFLLADFEDFTALSGRLPGETLAMLIGRWVAKCKAIIEEHGGAINKYLGDGFLAYWQEADATTAAVAKCLVALQVFQAEYELRFRIVVHHGLVAMGGVSSMGEESLIGREVNFAFRLEKLAGSLGELCMASEAAKAKLGDVLPFRTVGQHELKGFQGKHAVFAF